MFGDHVGNVIVDDVTAVACHFGRCRIDEVARIGRDHLHVDTVAVHVGEAGLKVRQFREVDFAALRLDTLGKGVDMRVGVRCFAAAGNAGCFENHRIRLGHHAVAVNVDGTPRFGFAGT